MQKIKNVLKGHRHGDREDEYETHGATVYDETALAGTGVGTGVAGTAVATGVSGHHHHHGVATGVAEEVVEERPVAVGVAEVPVVVTEEERRVHHHTGVAERTGEEVCGQKVFTEVEDRPVVKERVERILEHRPVEKQYVVETRYVGEREVVGAAGAEIVDVKERVVEAAAPGPKCPVSAGAMMTEATGGVAHTGTHSHTHASDRLL